MNTGRMTLNEYRIHNESRVDCLYKWTEDHEKTHAEHSRNNRQVRWLLVGIILDSLISVVLALVTLLR